MAIVESLNVLPGDHKKVEPAGHAFGAHVFTSAPGDPLNPVRTHVSYFDSGSPALADMADIAVGDYADVR